jgi:hypothetical protein
MIPLLKRVNQPNIFRYTTGQYMALFFRQPIVLNLSGNSCHFLILAVLYIGNSGAA